MRTNKVWMCLIWILAVEAGGTMAADQKAQTLKTEITKAIDCQYLLYLPKGYGEKDRTWPLMMFLHGAGERGENLNKVKVHGPPKLAEQGKDLPFIVVSPQCPAGQWWPEKLDTLAALLDEVESKYAVDKSRVYLTGLSMGGFGTWSLACHQPERFAAVAPICGGGERFLANRLKDVPVWAFHGAKDGVVPLEASKMMVDGVKRAGGDAKLTVYPEAGHDSWTASYDNEELYKWFLSRKTDRGAVSAATQKPMKLKQPGVKELDYLLALPAGYGDKAQSWPLILFLHGAGERGDNVEKVKVHGPPKLFAKGRPLPFIVVSPQCPRGQWWAGPEMTAALTALLDETCKTYQVDESRIYLTGLSMGGFGTWALGAAHPERFAAIAPICGGGQPETARQLVGMPIWVFHGAKDGVVPLAQSEKMVKAVKAAGGQAELTIYPDANHDSWTATYDNPKLYEWFLSHRKAKK